MKEVKWVIKEGIWDRMIGWDRLGGATKGRLEEMKFLIDFKS